MTLEEIYYISQIVASVAVLASLIFVTPLLPTSGGRGAGGEGGKSGKQDSETWLHSEQGSPARFHRTRTTFYLSMSNTPTLTPNPSPTRNGQERGERCEIRA